MWMTASLICGIARHQPVLHHVRQRVGVVQRHVGRQPDVQIEEHVVGRAARADVMAAEHARARSARRARDRVLGDHDAIAEDAVRCRWKISQHGVADEHRDDQRRQRIEHRVAEPHADQRDDHRAATSARRCACACASASSTSLPQPPAGAPLVGHDAEVHRRAWRPSPTKLAGEIVGRAAGPAGGRTPSDSTSHEHEQQEQQDADRRHRLELAMAVGMVVVGRLAGRRARRPGRRCSRRCR